jgi:hypothetical protein
MIGAVLVLILWFFWFFFSQTAISKVSVNARVTQEGPVVAAFPKGGIRADETYYKTITAEFLQKDMEDIQEGQTAFFYPDGKIGRKTGSIPATVIQIIKNSENNGQVMLSARLEKEFHSWVEMGQTGRVKVEVEYVSPAVLVMRASGFFDEAPVVSLNKTSSENGQ